MQCICGDRIKLYLKDRRFELSNFVKHLKLKRNISTSFTNNANQESDDQAIEPLHEIDATNQSSRTATKESINQNNSNMYTDSDNSSKSTTATARIK